MEKVLRSCPAKISQHAPRPVHGRPANSWAWMVLLLFGRFAERVAYRCGRSTSSFTPTRASALGLLCHKFGDFAAFAACGHPVNLGRQTGFERRHAAG